jgi:hypothetical protein
VRHTHSEIRTSIEFIDGNGGGPGFRLRRGKTKK